MRGYTTMKVENCWMCTSFKLLRFLRLSVNLTWFRSFKKILIPNLIQNKKEWLLSNRVLGAYTCYMTFEWNWDFCVLWNNRNSLVGAPISNQPWCGGTRTTDRRKPTTNCYSCPVLHIKLLYIVLGVFLLWSNMTLTCMHVTPYRRKYKNTLSYYKLTFS